MIVEGDGLTVDFSGNELVWFGVGIGEPVEASVGDVVLVPMELFWPWVAGVFGHPWDGLFALEIHPMTVLRVDDAFMRVGPGILLCQFVQFSPPLCCEFVAVIGSVFSSALDEVGKIT